ncbi:site-2 protease family protein [Candidatus Microgenomates bacterium]|nr:site-2 protease family protein [Candidatus Microgenomates bacterium]
MTLIIFLLILSLLVLIHELGHFIVAKLSGVKVEEFGFGFPPKIISLKHGETIYSLNLLPFGGFVRLYGEEEKVAKDAGRSFSAKPKKNRAAIIVAGVVMNFLLAIVAFSILYSFTGVPRKSEVVRVLGVLPNSPAEQGGIQSNDIVLQVNGERITSSKQFIQLIENQKGKTVNLEIKKSDGEIKTSQLIPRQNPPKDEGPVGVAISDQEQYIPPLWQRPLLGTYYGVKEAWLWGQQTLVGLGTMVSSLVFRQAVPAGIAGPVGIFQLTGSVAQQGMLALLHFVGILSINLAILNIIPFPALDGGRLLFVGIEAIFRGRARAIIPKVERIANMVGFALLITLLIAITFHDIRRIISQ